MNTKDYSGLMEAYYNVYDRSGNNLIEEVSEFCRDLMIFDEETELQYFVEQLFKDNELVLEFYYDVLSFCYGTETILTEEVEYLDEVRAGLISKGLQAAGGILKKLKPGIQKTAVTGMNQKTVVKKGIRPIGINSKGNKLTGDLYNDDLIRQANARAAKNAGIPAPEKPGKYLDMLKDKKAAAPKPSLVQQGWKRHTAAGGPSIETMKKRAVTDTALASMIGPAMMMAFPGAKTVAKTAATSAPIVRSATTAASKALPAAKTAAAKSPNPWNLLPKVKKAKQFGIPKTGPSSPVPNRVLPSGSTPKAALPPASSGRSQQYKDVEKLNKMTGGGLMGTTNIDSPRRAPKPAWGNSGTNGGGGTTSGGALVKAPKGGALAKAPKGGNMTDPSVIDVKVRDITPKPRIQSGSTRKSLPSGSSSGSSSLKPKSGIPGWVKGAGAAAASGGLVYMATKKDNDSSTAVSSGGTSGGTRGTSGGTRGTSGGTKGTAGGTKAPTGGTKAPTGGTKAPTGGTKAPTGGTKGTAGGTKAPTGGTKGSSPMTPSGGTVSDVSGDEKLTYTQRQAKELRDMRKKSQQRTISMGGKPATSLVNDDYNAMVADYLMSEGYADTNQAALAIMSSMSMEWKKSILESGYFPTKESQREDEKKYKLSKDRLPGEHNPKKPQKT